MRPKWMLFILLGITLAILGSTLRFPFMGDDIPQIVTNPRVQSWGFVPQYFTTHVWAHVPGAAPRFYRPFFLLQLRLINAIFGLWTPGWHLALVLSHLAAIVCVYWFVRQWKSDQIALIAAALFALHPVHAEVVSWISVIAEPWLAITLLASLALLRSEGKRNVVASCALFATALMFKETSVVWPLVIFLALYDNFAQSLRRTLPFVAIATGYLLLRVAVLGSLTSPLIRNTPPDPAYVPTALSHYLLHLIWPVGLSTYCNLHPTWAYILLLVPVLGFLLWVALRGEYERTAVLILLVPLLPVLNLSGLQLDALVQDRYLYISSIGFAMLASLLVSRLPKPAVVMVLLVMSFGLIRETQVWSDGEHFYARGFEVAPNNPEVRSGLGRIYADQGKYQEAIQMLDPLVRAGRAPAPILQQSLLTMAYCHEQTGNVSAALADYIAADRLSPTPEVEQRILLLRAKNSALR